MEPTQNILYITYKLTSNQHEMKVNCKGCREIITPDFDMPLYIKGIIKYKSFYVPVIDPNIYYNNRPTKLTNLASILILEIHNFHIGIILEDIDDVINLVTNNFRKSESATYPFNIHFIHDVIEKKVLDLLVNNTYMLMNMYEKQEKIDQDNVLFEEIVEENAVHI